MSATEEALKSTYLPLPTLPELNVSPKAVLLDYPLSLLSSRDTHIHTHTHTHTERVRRRLHSFFESVTVGFSKSARSQLGLFLIHHYQYIFRYNFSHASLCVFRSVHTNWKEAPSFAWGGMCRAFFSPQKHANPAAAEPTADFVDRSFRLVARDAFDPIADFSDAS